MLTYRLKFFQDFLHVFKIISATEMVNLPRLAYLDFDDILINRFRPDGHADRDNR